MPSHTTSPFHDLRFAVVTRIWGDVARNDLEREICPLCRARRLLGPFDDFRVAGQWLCCPDCSFAGDPVQWTAKVLKQSIRTTLRSMAAAEIHLPQGVEDPLIFDGYLRNLVRHRRAFQQLIEESARELPINEPTSLTRMQDRALRTGGVERRTVRTLMGASTAKRIAATFHPRARRQQGRLNGNGLRTVRIGSRAGRGSVFRGRKWQETLLIPFEDMPGRISGLYLMQDVPAPVFSDDFFRAVALESTHPRRREAGLCMLSLALSRATDPTCNTMFVVYDPAFAVKLQLLHLQDSIPSLPIVGAFADEQAESNAVFELVKNRQLVFWAPEPQLRRACLLQCCRSRGRFADLPDPRLSPSGTPPTMHLLQSLKFSAIPWDLALRKEIRRGTPEDGLELLRELHLPRHEHNRFFDELSPMVGESGHSAMMPRDTCPTIGQVLERADGWFDAATGDRLLNVRLRLDEQRHFSSGRVEDAGRLIFNAEREIPFAVSRADVSEKGLLPAVMDTLPASMRGEVQYDSGIGADAWRIATSFQSPIPRYEVDFVGLRKDQRLHFRNFTLQLGGRIELTRDPFVSPGAPAADFEPPQPLRKEAVARFSRSSQDNQIFWGIAACIAYNVIGSLFSYRRRSIALVGEGAKVIGGRAAHLLGCVEFKFPQCTSKTFAAALEDAVLKHGWPIYVELPRFRALYWRRALMASSAVDRCISPVPAQTSVSRMFRDWIIIRSERRAGNLDHLEHHAHRILPAYFHDLLQRRGPIPPSGNSSADSLGVKRILGDMSDWFGRQGGSSELVLEAGRLFQLEGRQCTSIVPR